MAAYPSWFAGSSVESNCIARYSTSPSNWLARIFPIFAFGQPALDLRPFNIPPPRRN
jgi:hypothetical protein